MPMAAAVSFSPRAELSQADIRDFVNTSYTMLQVPSPGNINVVQQGATHNRVFSDTPCLCIIEQPKSKWRYRYQSEKGSHGLLPGCTTTSSKKTFPAVKVMNYPENVDIHVRASLWTTDQDPCPHVHKLCGSPCSSDGTCTIKINQDGVALFQDITILFVPKKEVPKILFDRLLSEENSNLKKEQLKELAADKSKAMNLNLVRIRFEAICFNNDKTGYQSLCPPVYSEPVANQRSPKDGDLKICRMSACKGFANGGDEVYLLCSKVDKKDIQIRFYESSSLWEDFGKFTGVDVHQQCAIVFRTPPYQRRDITDPVKVLLQLQRKNGDSSESVEFLYIPNDPDEEGVSKKRKKLCMNQEFDEFKGDEHFQAQNTNRDLGAQACSPVLHDQNSPMGPESMNDNSLGSFSNSGAFSEEELNANFPSQEDMESFPENFDFGLFSNTTLPLENSDIFTRPHNIPLVSEANVPPVFISNQPSRICRQRFPSLQTDAAVVNIELPEDVGSEPVDGTDVSVKAKEVEEAFGKLSISGRSAADERSSFGSGSYEEKVAEGDLKGGQNTNMTLPETERFQPKTVSDASLNKIWHSLCIGLRKRNPFDFLRSIPQLIGFSNEDQNTLLHLAVSLEPPCEFIVECLLKTAEEARCPLVNYANKDRKTPLHIAVRAKKTSVVRLLLKYGADPTVTDREGSSSYHFAIYINSIECLRQLLDAGNYKLAPKTFPLDFTDYRGLAPLHYAVRWELMECIMLLCVHGADVNIRSKKDGRTPLHYAALQNCKVAKILLLQKTVDVNAQDYGGNTPLHLACSSKNSEVVRMLVCHGAKNSISNYDSSGVTPFSFAEGNEEIKIILKGNCTSFGSEVPSSNNSPCQSKGSGRSLELQCKSESNFCPKSGYTSTAEGDSGYISGDLSVLNEEVLQKLSSLLDPPNNSWETLMMCTINDEDFEKNILKLTASPTRAILRTFLNNGGTVESLIDALEAAALHEALDIVIQHVAH